MVSLGRIPDATWLKDDAIASGCVNSRYQPLVFPLKVIDAGNGSYSQSGHFGTR